MITIRNISNGCVLNLGDDYGEIGYTFDDDNINGLLELLYTISDSIKVSSRHDKYRIKLSIVHGDKFVCRDKKCKICKEGK